MSVTVKVVAKDKTGKVKETVKSVSNAVYNAIMPRAAGKPKGPIPAWYNSAVAVYVWSGIDYNGKHWPGDSWQKLKG